MATNLFRGSCTPNLGGVQDYYTKAEINQLLRQQGGPETLDTNHVWVGDPQKIQRQYLLDPDYFTVSHSTGLVKNLSADRLRSARNFSLTGVVTGTVSSNLATGFSIATSVAAGSITGAMIGVGTITNTNIGLGAEIAVSKLADGASRQLLETAADGTTVQWATNIDVPGTLDVTGFATFDSDVTVSGNLTVQGELISIEVETLRVENKNIELGVVATPTNITADGGGIILLGSTNKTILWGRATESWSLSEHLNIASGRSYRINNIPVLSATALGSSVQISTDNIPAGTVTSGDLAGGIAVSKLADGTARQLLETAADGSTVQWATNIDVPGTLDVTGVATFDTKISIGVAEPTSVREIGWSNDQGTYEILLNSNVPHHLGSDQTTLCRNNSNTVAIPKGTAVMFAGTVGNSGRIKVAPMVANGTVPGYVFFGVTESIVPGGGDGYVKSFGEIKGINTNAYSEQSILWCDPVNPGGFTATEPQAPNLKLSVAAVISSTNNGVLMIRWDTGNRLKDLHDVEVTGTPLNGDILKYNTSLSRWENSSSVSISGNISLGSSITFEGATANDFETVLSVVDPTADRAISIPNQSGNLLVSGNASIVDADISASAEIAVSKLADGAARQLLETAADGVTVQWATNIDVPGTLDVTGDAVFDSRVTINGADITESARDIEESRLIRRNATLSIGTPGTVPFGVGPMVPPGMSLVGIGADAYNVIDIYSGSVC